MDMKNIRIGKVGVRGSIGNEHEETPATAINYAVFSE